MVEITKKTCERNGVEVIVFNDKKGLNETNIKDSNLAAVTLKYPPNYKKTKTRITKLWKKSAL